MKQKTEQITMKEILTELEDEFFTNKNSSANGAEAHT